MGKKDAVEKAPKKQRGAKRGSQVKLISFTVTAVIPTQQFGNIQPRIEVSAPSIDEARAVVMPMIEELYQLYAEMPLSGKDPRFYGKITETVKQVIPANVQQTQQKAPEVAVQPTQVVSNDTQVAPPAPQKSEPVIKAEKAISLAMTEDALVMIQGQIEKSVKISPEEKPDLLTMCLKRRGELAK